MNIRIISTDCDNTVIAVSHLEKGCRVTYVSWRAIRTAAFGDVAENFNTPLNDLLQVVADPEPEVRVALVIAAADLTNARTIYGIDGSLSERYPDGIH